MAKLRCKTMQSGAVSSNKYKGVSGIEYRFSRDGAPTVVKNKDDVASFLKSGNFVKEGVIGKVEEVISDAIDKVKGDKKEKKEKLSYQEIKDMIKDDQVALLRKLGSKESPRYEKQRIELILKLQEKNKGD